MRKLTIGMNVKETREWIEDKRKNFKKLTWEEVNEFNEEIEAIRQEEDGKAVNKIYKIIGKIAVCIAVVP